MNGIALNYNKTVTVLRLKDDTVDSDKEAYDTHIVSLSCHIQPLDDSYTGDVEGNFGKDSVLFCDVNDILESDRVVDGAVTYQIVGLEKFNFLGEDRHMELRIRQFIQ